MILKSREVDVVEGNPFLNDKLNRKESADVLTEFVLSSKDPLVVCLDAPWGQGKTTFLRMWEQHLKDNEIPTIYFNAWENDFTDDAFVSLIGEIGASIDEISNYGNEDKVKEYYQKAKNLGLGLVKRTVPVAAKVATAGALDLDKITEQALSSFAESIAKDQIEKYESAKKTLRSFREELTKLASSISAEKNKPLVFIIDELDRCRPNFSIEILEKAKHFFNVENIIFVLGADKVQLGHSIKAVYGSELNVNGYLRRFIDFDYLLPPPEKGLFVKAQFNKYSFKEYFSAKNGEQTRYEGEQALKMFTELFELYQLTLREQEHCCSLLSLSIRTTPTNHSLFPLFLCLLIVIKIKEPDLYKRFVCDELTTDGLLAHLKSVDTKDELLSSNYGIALEAYIVSSKSNGYVDNAIMSKYQAIRDSSEASDVEKHRANRVIEIIDRFDWNGGIGSLSYLVKKIEIASRFSS
ncbi:hypothetical protein HOP38_20435 [Vibrio mediterranei]|uniref:KAP family P-loop NTPase fold protein n=1 Tax=Vibrio mediterranei TaxID=689 RepID=UPI0017D5C67E|nr:P-loop NTPase fold protein [Vibrio mediterranei]NUW74869.1 hypothetical protein [Vibrio mediterranei]